ncbi:MAG: DUF2934 domain-containing protein [Myxococcota bacterium]
MARTSTSRPTAEKTLAPKPRETTGPFGPTFEQISKRAYELWQARGGAPGSPEEDWYQAERELRLGKH